VLGVLGVALALVLADAGTAAGKVHRAATIDLAGAAGATCPSAPVLAAALDARLPGITSPRGPSGGGPTLGLELADAGGGSVRLALLDTDGRRLLERTFAGADAAGGDRAASCAALADTVALVVERYLRDLAYREPGLLPTPAAPSPPATAIAASSTSGVEPWRPPLLVAAGVGVRPGGRWPARTEPEIVVDVPVRRLLLSAAAAVTLPVETPVPTTDGGRFRYEALPLRIGLGVPFPLPGRAGWVAPTALAGVDLFRGETRLIAMPAVAEGVAPVVELGAVAAVRLGRLMLRPHALVGLRRERRFELSDPALAGVAVFTDPSLSIRVGADLGFAFEARRAKAAPPPQPIAGGSEPSEGSEVVGKN